MIITDITRAAADTLFAKIEASAKPLAVFIQNGCVRTTRVGTELFHSAIESKVARFMGVYDSEVMPEWLEEDIAYMGVK